jgi:hypothetical protein
LCGWLYCAETRNLSTTETTVQEHGKLYLKTKWAKLNLGHLMKDYKKFRKRKQIAFIEVCGEFDDIC